MKTLRRIVKVVVLVAIILFASYVIYPIAVYDFIFPSKAKTILGDTNVEKRIKEIRGDYLTFGDDQWIAIVYEDFHGDIIPHWRSLAIARTSENEWLQSEEHYCMNLSKRLSNLERQELANRDWYTLTELEAIEEGKALEESKELIEARELIDKLKEDEIYPLYSAKSVDEAKEALVSLGFYQIDVNQPERATP
ncbi:MAG: hypothetical protein LR011_08965 [Verrucomicrobia bacterium]|nr:hypothetical protein [Verrucomicrobiota bacterium]